MPIPDLNPPLLDSAARANLPEKPDAFTDGSLSDAKHPEFGFSTAPVWWPGRQLDQSPLSDLEYYYTEEKQETNGLATSSFINGYDSSSSRAELLGLILALFSDRLCHIAVDSSAVLGPAKRIQQWIHNNMHLLSSLRLLKSVEATQRLCPLGKYFDLIPN
eukprot:5722898-Karenia_brevis.AAC.1